MDPTGIKIKVTEYQVVPGRLAFFVKTIVTILRPTVDLALVPTGLKVDSKSTLLSPMLGRSLGPSVYGDLLMALWEKLTPEDLDDAGWGTENVEPSLSVGRRMEPAWVFNGWDGNDPTYHLQLTAHLA